MNPEKPVKFIIHTIGCKTNQAESDDIARQLILKGCCQAGLTDSPDSIDYIIINTCTVTSAADRKARHLIRKLQSAGPKSKLIITGCFAQLNGELPGKIPADFIFSNNKKNEIADFICAADLAKADTADVASMPHHIHSRALVKIQDGCQQGCSYCIVPQARGPYSSTAPSMIIEAIKRLVTLGHDEIVLTGIHIGKFGVDLLSGKNEIKTLPELVLEILKNTDVKRLRLSSIEINEIDESLIGVIKSNIPKIAPHLHVPLQSGSDNILKAMNRKYDSGFFISAIEQIKGAIPGITLTTDIIVGFPGETPEDFAKTVKLVKDIDFSKIHVFKYSKRPGTKAAAMAGQVQENIKTERSRILRGVGLDLRNNFITSNIGKKLDVVCEEYDKKNGIAGGTSENYIKVYFGLNYEEYKLKKGKILKVFAKTSQEDGLYGEVI